MVTAATPAKTGPLTYKRITQTVAPSASAQPEPPNATHTRASSGRRFKAWPTGKWEPSRSTLEPSQGLPTISPLFSWPFLKSIDLPCGQINDPSVRSLIVCFLFLSNTRIMVFKGMANKGILDWVLKIVTKIRVLSTQKLCSIRVFLNSFCHKRAEMAQVGWKIPYFVIISWKIRVFQYPWLKN